MFDWFTVNQRRKYDNVQQVLVNKTPLSAYRISRFTCSFPLFSEG